MRNPVKFVFGIARRVVDVVVPGSSTNGDGPGGSGPAPVTPPPSLTDRARRTAEQVADVTTGVVTSAATMVRERVTDDGPTTEVPDDGSAGSVGATDAPRPGVGYEDWTKAELYERAQELDIAGRSQMTKDELITALRDAS